MAHYELDARRLFCPLPVIRTQDRIKSLELGDTLSVTATDPGVLHDIPAWCRVHGHQILETKQIDKEFIILIRVVK